MKEKLCKVIISTKVNTHVMELIQLNSMSMVMNPSNTTPTKCTQSLVDQCSCTTRRKAQSCFWSGWGQLQPECINTSHRVGPNGKRLPLPKNIGMSTMISAFQCSETGCGIHLSHKQLPRVNDMHCGTQYFDSNAARDVLGSSTKSSLTCSPFICKFEFSGTND